MFFEIIFVYEKMKDIGYSVFLNVGNIIFLRMKCIIFFDVVELKKFNVWFLLGVVVVSSFFVVVLDRGMGFM